jgi:hypothetical protein
MRRAGSGAAGRSQGTPNQTLEQTAGAGRLSGVHSSPSPAAAEPGRSALSGGPDAIAAESIGSKHTMNILLWVLQVLAALLYAASGVMKVFMFEKVS